VDKPDPGASNPVNTGYTTKVIEPQATAHVAYLAHHWLLLAVPAFLPAVIVVTVVLYIALRDRRAGRSEAGGKPDDASQPADTANQKRD
jgi:hypothetical protein